MRISDWSSDVCSSDLFGERRAGAKKERRQQRQLYSRRPYLPMIPHRALPFSWSLHHSGNGALSSGLSGKGRHFTHTAGDLQIEIHFLTNLRRIRYCGRCLRSEEHTSELQSLMRISYAVFCLKK